LTEEEQADYDATTKQHKKNSRHWNLFAGGLSQTTGEALSMYVSVCKATMFAKQLLLNHF